MYTECYDNDCYQYNNTISYNSWHLCIDELAFQLAFKANTRCMYIPGLALDFAVFTCSARNGYNLFTCSPTFLSARSKAPETPTLKVEPPHFMTWWWPLTGTDSQHTTDGTWIGQFSQETFIPELPQYKGDGNRKYKGKQQEMCVNKSFRTFHVSSQCSVLFWIWYFWIKTSAPAAHVHHWTLTRRQLIFWWSSNKTPLFRNRLVNKTVKL